MDTRRLLIPAACWLLLSSCALIRPPVAPSPVDLAAHAPVAVAPPGVATAGSRALPDAAGSDTAQAALLSRVQASPSLATSRAPSATERSYEDVVVETTSELEAGAGRGAPREAVAPEPESTSAETFVGEVRVFDWAPGRVFEIRAAPLRVTTLTLAPGEVLISKAAGDTVRWQIGEIASGVGVSQQTHVLLKPLGGGLETNLVLTTNRRVYLIDLVSGPVSRFDTAVAWSRDDVQEASTSGTATTSPVEAALSGSPPVALPQGEPDGRYRIEPQGRNFRWTPTAVFNDGLRTFITFDPDLQVAEAPALFVVAPNGERQLVNYRQVGGLFVVDRIFDRAELRLGDRRPQVVVLRRLGSAA